MRGRGAFLFSLVFAGALLPLHADRFELRDGRVFNGKLVGISEGGDLKIQSAAGLVTIPQQDLKAIRRDRQGRPENDRQPIASVPDAPTEPEPEPRAAAPAGANALSRPDWRLMVPGWSQYISGSRTQGAVLFVGFFASTLASAYYYNELARNAERAGRSPAYHLYLDPSFRTRHRQLTRAYQASGALAAGFYLAHGGDLLHRRFLAGAASGGDRIAFVLAWQLVW